VALLSLDLSELLDLGAEALLLCSTQRLARNLRRRHDRLQRARGINRWPTLDAQTPESWLAESFSDAALAGEVRADALLQPLSEAQESVLWERAIAVDGVPEALLDREGLSRTAIQANALVEVWRVHLPASCGGEETRAFLRWRKEFRRLAREAGCCDAASLFDRQLDVLEAGAGRLPAIAALAGFDRYNPQELRLIAALERRGVDVRALQLGRRAPAEAVAHGLPDRLAECRAAAAWARERLARDPGVRLGLVVPELSALRVPLESLLDDALDPSCLSPARAEAPRRYNFSLGPPLAQRGIVDAALRLLTLASGPRHVAQEDFSALLRDPYWSAGEADARARLDARLRERLPLVTSLPRLARLAEGEAARGLPIAGLVRDLMRFQEVLPGQPARQLPSAWAAVFGRLLEAAGWPGMRPLSSHEYQAQRAFFEVLASLGELDAVQGRVVMGAARSRLAQLCRDRVFQPETENEPALEVMGLLEALAAPLDGLWVMGMNAHLWPPPAAPNPLLPAELQRAAATPGASGSVQSEFAAAIQRRLLSSAEELHFSWALSEGDRALRASPLLAGIPHIEVDAGTSASLIDSLAGTSPMASISDAQAPPLVASQATRGGTAVLRTQAICPAWAFYRYRLGAKALASPAVGLTGAERGALVHRALQYWWRGRTSEEVRAMDRAARDEALASAVAQAVRTFNAAREQALSPRVLALESERLRALIDTWVDVELTRPLPFRVQACESESEAGIEGLRLKIVVDRIDELADGRLVILDYKTGRSGSAASWGAERITEPQLPIYAVGAEPAPAAVALARVRLDEPGFAGIACEAGILPRVPGIDEPSARRLFPREQNWVGLMEQWRQRLAAIAAEFMAGEARVTFLREADLAYCEVLPLLRLAERRRQFEEQEQRGGA